MDLALNNLQRLICLKNPNKQTNKQWKFLVISAILELETQKLCQFRPLCVFVCATFKFHREWSKCTTCQRTNYHDTINYFRLLRRLNLLRQVIHAPLSCLYKNIGKLFPRSGCMTNFNQSKRIFFVIHYFLKDSRAPGRLKYLIKISDIFVDRQCSVSTTLSARRRNIFNRMFTDQLMAGPNR